MIIRSGAKGSAGSFDFEAMRCLGVASTGGAGVGECLAALERIRRNDIESWTTEFGTLAGRLEHEGVHSLETGDPVSAAGQFRRASTYYRVAAFYLSAEDARQHRYRQQSRETFQRSLGCVPTRTEIIAIPFEGVTMPGYFVRGGEGEARPTLLVLGGYDSTAEELMLWLGEACGARGWNALVFDGPGQPGGLGVNPGLVFRPDYEVPVGAAIDHALTRSDVDPERLAIIGYSFGGYLAPRAAARDPRIRAVIANTLGVDIGNAMRMALPPFLWKLPAPVIDAMFGMLTGGSIEAQFFFTSAREAFGVSSPSEFLRVWEPYNLWSVRDDLAVPLLILLSEDELIQAPRTVLHDTFKFLQGVKAPIAFRVFTREEGAAAHCQLDSPERMPPVLFQWLGAIFGHAAEARDDRRADDEGFARLEHLLRAHHGAAFVANVDGIRRAQGIVRAGEKEGPEL
jgi:pimeloyl-ACP methyl ester carboxylesterase